MDFSHSLFGGKPSVLEKNACQQKPRGTRQCANAHVLNGDSQRSSTVVCACEVPHRKHGCSRNTHGRVATQQRCNLIPMHGTTKPRRIVQSACRDSPGKWS